MTGPLHGVRIIEFEGIGPVPFCGMMLADMGAEIVLVCSPKPRGLGMPVPPDKDPLFRGRSRLPLDLKDPASVVRLAAIIAKADILLEGYRPGVMERLGLGPDMALKVNPRLVYGRLTGWGQDGPLAQTAGHDPNYMAIAGVLHTLGYADRPPTPPLNLVGDFAGGSLFMAMGVLAALTHVRAGGAGQVVDAAMLDGSTALMTMVYSMRQHGLWSDARGANIMDGSCPFGCAYETADGRYVMTCCMEPPFYAQMLQGLGLADDAAMPAQYDRANWPMLHQRLAAAFCTKTRDEWATVFEGTDACVTPILDLGEAQTHTHNVARGVFEDGLPRPAPRFSATLTHAARQNGPEVDDLLKSWDL